MPANAKLPSGSRRAQVRRNGRYVSETFLRRDDALRRSRLAKLSVDRNETSISARIGRLTKFGELVHWSAFLTILKRRQNGSISSIRHASAWSAVPRTHGDGVSPMGRSSIRLCLCPRTMAVSVSDSQVFGTGVVTGEEGVLSVQGDGADRALDGVSVDLDTAIGQKAAEAVTVSGDVGQSLAE